MLLDESVEIGRNFTFLRLEVKKIRTEKKKWNQVGLYDRSHNAFFNIQNQVEYCKETFALLLDESVEIGRHFTFFRLEVKKIRTEKKMESSGSLRSFSQRVFFIQNQVESCRETFALLLDESVEIERHFTFFRLVFHIENTSSKDCFVALVRLRVTPKSKLAEIEEDWWKMVRKY